MQQKLLLIAGTVPPILALIFVTALFLYKLYINVRSRYDIKVNCWFCNQNTRVAYSNRNSWTCPQCEQYNGFDRDGGYNRDLNSSSNGSSASQHTTTPTSTICANAYYANELAAGGASVGDSSTTSNGLCDQCNESQRLKVEKLAQFEPKHESRFEQELKIYKQQLEQQFRLCGSCERHVNRVLHEKKKMVLGSKFLNFIIKGAALLKEPHFDHLAQVQKHHKLQWYQRLMLILTLLNVIGLLSSLPTATRDQFHSVLGSNLGQLLFVIYTHLLTCQHVLMEYAGQTLGAHPWCVRLVLFGRTIFKMLVYSLDLPQQLTVAGCFTTFYPYAMLALSFLHCIVNGLSCSRFTLLLVMWSIYANGVPLLCGAIDGIGYALLGSVLTLVLLVTQRRNTVLEHNQSVGDSFHRLYADECMGDEETISMLSQQLSYNASSTATPRHSPLASPAPSAVTMSQRHRMQAASPIASSALSLDSLHLSGRGQASVNYAATCMDQPQSCRSMASTYGAWPQRPTSNAAMPRPIPASFGPAHVRNQARSNNQTLLLPSRLQYPHRNGDVSAWVAATSSAAPHPDMLDEPSTANIMAGYADNKQMSRTSSQSSGFESCYTHPQQHQQQQHHQHQLPFISQQTTQQPHPEYAWPVADQATQSRLLIPPPLPSPYSTQSVLHFDRTAPCPLQIRPGDLLRKWLDSADTIAHQPRIG